jgi:hypothetical protein
MIMVSCNGTIARDCRVTNLYNGVPSPQDFASRAILRFRSVVSWLTLCRTE